MTAPQFDTLRAAKTLKQGGFNENEAETLVNTLDQAVNENLGTKADLKLLQAEVKQGFTKANAATEKASTEAKAATDEAKAATDKLRSDTNQGFTKSEAATEKASTEAKAATDKLRSDIEKAIIQTDAANEKRFATLYRYLLVGGASIMVMMITLFLVN